ncbi:MAG: hypothetical protein KC619_07545 [Myxococcales bacterium]|nr:hypothetical protein [Myxococcales bacterium]
MVELNLRPDDRTLRQFGWIALVGFAALAALAFWELGIFAFGLGAARVPVTATLGGLGGLSALFSLVYPKANRVLFVLLSVLSFPIGFVMSYVILGTIFFGLFAPIALLFRLIGRDALRRKTGSAKDSYWQKARPTRPKGDYFRQY